jgi:hypothetical protein
MLPERTVSECAAGDGRLEPAFAPPAASDDAIAFCHAFHGNSPAMQ